MPKKLTGYGPNCAGGAAPFNDGRYIQKSGQPGAPSYTCVLCQRVVNLKADGTVKPHVWERKLENVKVGDRVSNSQANLARRAFERTRGKA